MPISTEVSPNPQRDKLRVQREQMPILITCLFGLFTLLAAPALADTEAITSEAVHGDALVRQAGDLRKEIDRLIEKLMRQGFQIKIGEIKGQPNPKDQHLVDLIVPITVKESSVFAPTVSALAASLGGTAYFGLKIRATARDYGERGLHYPSGDYSGTLVVVEKQSSQREKASPQLENLGSPDPGRANFAASHWKDMQSLAFLRKAEWSTGEDQIAMTKDRMSKLTKIGASYEVVGNEIASGALVFCGLPDPLR